MSDGAASRRPPELAGQGLGSRAFYQVARSAVVSFVRLVNRTTVEGREHIPASGAFILAPVHRSNLDTPIAATVTRRRLRYMGKHTLWRTPFWAWFLSALGGFPVVRGTADLEALKRCLEVIDAGEPLVLFPEGERKSGPVVQPLHGGAAWVAAKTGVPIVPVGIGGSEAAMPKGAKLVLPHKVHVIVGEAIVVPRSEGRKVDRQVVADATAQLHDELQRLFDQASARAGA